LLTFVKVKFCFGLLFDLKIYFLTKQKISIMSNSSLNLTKINLSPTSKPNFTQLIIKRATTNAQLSGTQTSKFLDEGVLVDNCIHCCFFKSDNVFNGEDAVILRDYRLGYIVLPQDIQYVDYEIDKDTGMIKIDSLDTSRSNYSDEKSKEEIFTPLFFDSVSSTESNKTTSFIQMPLHVCDRLSSAIVQPPIQGVRPNPCLAHGFKNANHPFHLFYLEGRLFLPNNSNIISGKFYMIPLMTSEGLIAYYTIPFDENDVARRYQQQLNTMALLIKTGKNDMHWSINSELKYNDHLTIVTCTDIEPFFG
jgi:hypothetical protein